MQWWNFYCKREWDGTMLFGNLSAGNRWTLWRMGPRISPSSYYRKDGIRTSNIRKVRKIAYFSLFRFVVLCSSFLKIVYCVVVCISWYLSLEVLTHGDPSLIRLKVIFRKYFSWWSYAVNCFLLLPLLFLIKNFWNRLMKDLWRFKKKIYVLIFYSLQCCGAAYGDWWQGCCELCFSKLSWISRAWLVNCEDITLYAMFSF